MPTEIYGSPSFQPILGGSGATGSSILLANVNTTPVGTISNTTETDLMTYVLPANTLNANNIGVRITAWGNSLAAANNQTIKLFFGGTSFVQIGSGALGTAAWRIVAEVIRTGSGAQAYGAWQTSGTGFFLAYSGTLGTTDTNPITIKVTGTNGVATVDGVKQLGFSIEVINLPGGGAVPNPYLPASLNQSTATQIKALDGTAGAPAITFASDPTTGIYTTGSTIAFAIGGGNYGGLSGIGFYSSVETLTSGTMTYQSAGRVKKAIHRFDWTNAMIVALGGVGTGDITVCTLPAKFVITNAYIVLLTPDSSANALTVSLGRVSATFLDYIGNSDAKAAANTVYGDVVGERGANLTGYDVPSFTATTDIKCHFIKTTTNLSTVTGCTGSVYIETMSLP